MPLSRHILRVWQCVELGDEWYLKADMAVRCFDSTWSSYATASFFVGALVILGVPVTFLLLVMMEKNRRIDEYIWALRPVLRPRRISWSRFWVMCTARLRRAVRCMSYGKVKGRALLFSQHTPAMLRDEVDLMLQRARAHELSLGRVWSVPVGAEAKIDAIAGYLGASNLASHKVMEHIGFMYESCKESYMQQSMLHSCQLTRITAVVRMWLHCRSTVAVVVRNPISV